MSHFVFVDRGWLNAEIRHRCGTVPKMLEWELLPHRLGLLALHTGGLKDTGETRKKNVCEDTDRGH